MADVATTGAIGSRSVGVKLEELLLLLLRLPSSRERKQSINGQVAVVVVDGPVAGVNAASVPLTATRWSIVVRSSVTTI